MVTVEDKVAPVVVTQNLTIQLDAAGHASITAAQVDNGSTDNCAIASSTLNISNFDCANLDAPVTVILTVTDVHGNATGKTAVISVEDTVLPTFTRPANISVYTDAACGYNAGVTATGDVTDEHDNCTSGLQATFTDVIAPGACEGSKLITRTWHLVDGHGNAAADPDDHCG